MENISGIYFQIYGTDGVTKIGGIRKVYPNSCRESLRTADLLAMEGKFII